MGSRGLLVPRGFTSSLYDYKRSLDQVGLLGDPVLLWGMELALASSDSGILCESSDYTSYGLFPLSCHKFNGDNIQWYTDMLSKEV